MEELLASNIIVFLLDSACRRIPTRKNLDQHKVIDQESLRPCVLCEGREETSNHLFLHCEVSRNVWLNMFRCLDFNFPISSYLFIHL